MVIFLRAHSRTAKRLKCRNIQRVITPIWWLLVINSDDTLKQTIWPLEFKQHFLIWKAKVVLSAYAHENCSHGVRRRFFCCSSRFRNKVISWAGNKYVISAKSFFKFCKYPLTKRSNFLHLIMSFFCNISSSGNSELSKIKLCLHGLLNETSIIRSPPTQMLELEGLVWSKTGVFTSQKHSKLFCFCFVFFNIYMVRFWNSLPL